MKAYDAIATLYVIVGVALVIYVAWAYRRKRKMLGYDRAQVARAWFAIAIIVGTLLAILVANAPARDLDGRYAAQDPALHQWFDHLASGRGLCCSFADGKTVENVDWDTGGPNNGYRVRLDGKWIDVPDTALITEPNKYGPAVVWPYQDGDGVTQIRCFLPGAGA